MVRDVIEATGSINNKMLRPRDQIHPLFEYSDCPLCGSNSYTELYVRNHYFDHYIGHVKIVNVICDQCGFMYMNPRFKDQILQAHYRNNSSGDVYHETDHESRHGKLNCERKTFIERYLKKVRAGNFLDIGCGQADLLRSLDLNAWRKYGLEPSDAPLRTARKEHIFMTTIQHFKPKMVFQAISCISVLEHIIDPVGSLMKINKLLRNEGYFFVEVPDSKKPKAQIAEFFSFEHLSHFTKRTLEEMLAMCGFCVVDYDLNVNLHNIRCVAQKSGSASGKWRNESSDDSICMKDKHELVPVINKYKREKQLIISKIGNKINRIISELRGRNEKIVIYGAGMHTRFLLDSFDLSDLVECLIDSDPKKAFSMFQKWPVYPPNYIPKLHVAAILISSHDFEKEIFRNIRDHYKDNIKAIRCYGE